MENVIDIWNELTYEQKLAATRIVFEKINDHINEGGTYRYLIYDRLGFNSDAYIALYPQGMNISNACFELQEKDK